MKRGDRVGRRQLLCTDDFGYQAFRNQIHQPAWQREFLARSHAERSAFAPDLPTYREQGHPGLQMTEWFGVFAPAKTPAAVVQRVAEAEIWPLVLEHIEAKVPRLRS